jgi:hypothetical protein
MLSTSYARVTRLHTADHLKSGQVREQVSNGYQDFFALHLYPNFLLIAQIM